MKLPLISRRAYDDLRARYEYAVELRAEAREELADWKGSAIRVAGRNTELTRRLEMARYAGGDDAEYTAQLERRVERLAKGVGRYLAALWKARAEVARLTKQAAVDKGVKGDLSRRLGLAEQQLRKAEQPAWAEGLPPRPVSPSEELLQARAQARALEERLAEMTVANQRCTCQRWEAITS